MKALLLVGIILGLMIVSGSTQQPEAKVRFDRYKLVDLELSTDEQVQAIIDAIHPHELDVWSNEGTLHIGHNHVLLPPCKYLEQALLAVIGIDSFPVLIENVQDLIDQQDHDRSDSKVDAGLDFFKDFHPYEEIVNEVEKLVEKHDSIATFNPSIGTSIQGREIVAVTIHGGPSGILHVGDDDGVKNLPASVPKVFFMGGQHAREWISPATVMYVINQLLTGYGTNPVVTDILNKVAVVIVPVANPDGYDYSWTNNRLWRKNRRQNAGGTYGVDLNRNWDTHWCTSGASKTPSSDTYCGTAPFSEPETKAVSDYIKSLGNVVGGIDWHAYGQLVLRPYGWTKTSPPNNAELVSLGAKMKEAIRTVHGKAYTNEGAWELYYTTGSADDWMYESVNITLSYTIELRDTGRYGFVLPKAEIIPTGEEAWKAVTVFIQTIIDKISN